MARASDEFVTQLDATGVIETHIQQILGLEESASARIFKIYQDIRQRLRDRLDTLRVDKFEAQVVRGVLAQVEMAIFELQKQLSIELQNQANVVTEAGISHTVQEIQTFEETFTGAVQPVRFDQVLVAESTKALKMLQYKSSIQTYGQSTIDQVNRFLVDATVMQKPYAQVVRDISGATGSIDGESWKAQRLVRTELHSIYDMTRLNSLVQINKDSIPDLMKISIDPIDHRTGLDSIAVKNQILKLDEPFGFKGQVLDPKKGEKVYIEVKPFMNHPNRPNDRGVSVPYRKVWEK